MSKKIDTADGHFKSHISNEWRHFLQTEEWADIKRDCTAWSARRLPADDTEVYLYSRKALGVGAIHYIPKISKISEKYVDELTANLKQSVGGGVCLSLEIDQPYSEKLDEKMLSAGWLSTTSIQYDETVIVDLDRPEDEIYKSFKKRARWELSAAGRRGAVAERVPCTQENMDILFDMLAITSARGNFSIRNKQFHQYYWKRFAESGTGYMYFVRHEDDILSAAYVMKVGNRGFYKDGASIREKSNLFASRLMHWQIIKDLMAEGVTSYDMCGVMNSKHTDDRNKGILTFKTGFAEVVRLQASYTLPLNASRYKLWTKIEAKYVALYFKLKKDLWY